MHRIITESIKIVLLNHRCSGNIYQRITIIPKENCNNGFWKMEIVMKPKYKHMVSHVEKLGIVIGNYYGEGLFSQMKGRTVKFS